jgi:hypothetical protein
MLGNFVRFAACLRVTNMRGSTQAAAQAVAIPTRSFGFFFFHSVRNI